MMNENDKALTYASQIIGGDIEISRTEFESLQQRIATALTTVRKEARAAAFKEALSAINAVPMSRYWTDSGEEIARSFRAQAIRRIEAAANTEEGGGDG